MVSTVRAVTLALIAAAAMLLAGLTLGLVVAYWSHVWHWTLIVLGLASIACLTCWSD